jgi:hypothetical protein
MDSFVIIILKEFRKTGKDFRTFTVVFGLQRRDKSDLMSKSASRNKFSGLGHKNNFGVFWPHTG